MPNSHKSGSGFNFAVGTAFALMLAACGSETASTDTAQGGEAAVRAPAGQVVATINGRELTIHELNLELSKLDRPEGTDQDEFEQSVLRALLVRNGMRSRAQEAGLDRSPQVLLETRRAESAVLARAYLYDQLRRQPQVTRDDALDYVNENPAQFSERTYYVFDAFSAPAEPFDEAFKDELEALGDMDAIARELRARGITFRDAPYSVYSDRLPGVMQEQMPSLNRNRTVFFINRGNEVIINRVRESRAEPITGDDAIVLARRILTGERNRAFIVSLQQAILNEGDVTFSGRFEDLTLGDLVGDTNPVDSLEEVITPAEEPAVDLEEAVPADSPD